ncbi:hypothetical protein AB1Y20_004940 [Prymnesium parvum]|uniref:BTB domain-containing protein n=1 Tax=Prymnesium parvum TaxID=97485 RepID=A0AB34J542_PRYPA
MLTLLPYPSAQLSRGVHADVRFVLRDGEVWAHRCVLSARSEYFRRSLAWGGARVRTVRVADASSAAFWALLRHVYSASPSTLLPQPEAAEAEGAREEAEAEVEVWERLAAHAAHANRAAAAAGGARAARGALGAAGALEVRLLARRYMLPSLEAQAAARLQAELTPAEVVPLLLTAQHEGDDEAAALVSEWAVANFEAVAAQIDSWVGGRLLSAPECVRQLEEEQLVLLREQLRAAMVKQRFGLG